MIPRGTGGKRGRKAKPSIRTGLQTFNSEVCIPDPDYLVSRRSRNSGWMSLRRPIRNRDGTGLGRLRGREMREWPMSVDVSSAILPAKPLYVLDNHRYGCC